MTTKNWEFDLQLFAVTDSAPTIKAASGTFSVEGKDQATLESTAAGTDVVDTDTSVTYRTDTVTSSATVYAFSGSEATDTAVNISTVVGSTATPVYYADNVSVGAGTGTDVTVTAAENTTIASPLWLTGGGVTSTVEVQYSSSNNALHDTLAFGSGSSASLGLTASGSAISYSSLRGSMQASLATEGTFNKTINGAAINASLTSKAVTLTGPNDDTTGVTLMAEGNASLISVDANQVWNVSTGNNVAYKRLQATATTETLSATKDANGDYLAVNLDDGAEATFATGSGSGTPTDLVSVNDVLLNGAGKAQATVAKENDTVLTATFGTSAGVFAVGANSIGGAISSVASGATATIVKVTTDTTVIKAVDAIAANAYWSVAGSAGEVVLGNDSVTFADEAGTIRADSSGSKVGGLTPTSGNVAVNAVGDHTVTVGSASWTADLTDDNATLNAVFDPEGNVTINAIASATDAGKGEFALNISGGASRSISMAGAVADTLALENVQTFSTAVTSLPTAANGIAEGSTWLVSGGSGVRSVKVGDGTYQFAKATDSVYGNLTASSVNGASISAVSNLTGDVTVTADAISGTSVMGKAWSVSGASVGAVVFDSTGAGASLAATDALNVAAADVVVTVAGENSQVGGIFNGATVTTDDGDNQIIVQLDSDVSVAGLAGITSLNSGANVKGDSAFTVNDQFNVAKLTNTVNGVDITVGSSASITVNDVVDGDAYVVSGGTVIYDVDSTSTGGSAKVSINTAEVTLTAGASANLDNVNIVSNDSDDIVSIRGLTFGDTVKTSGDSVFAASFDASSARYSANTVAVAVNDVGVTMRGGSHGGFDADTVQMYVSKSGSKPNVTLSGIAKNSTITVGAGVYSVGSSATVEVNDSVGYLYVDNNGNVTAEDSVVAQIRIDRDDLVRQLAGSVSTTVEAYKDFYNIYDETSRAYGDEYGKVASYLSATVDSPATTIAPGAAVNIFGDDALGAGEGSFPRNVTLQTSLKDAINIEQIEGLRTGVSTIRTAVIDASSSTNTLIAVGLGSGSEFATNHTILGSALRSTLLVGSQAVGNNYIKAGNGGAYIYNQGGTASIFGGEGSDTIFGAPSDHIEGGAGIDYFYDTNSFEVADYSFDDRDVIVATKLASIANLTPDNLYLNGNQIAIMGGSTVTVETAGEEYDNATQSKVIVADANASGRRNVMWVGNYGTSLDASDVTINGGVLMVSSINGGQENTIIGSSGRDTIYAGPNDIVNAGSGQDTVKLAAADTGAGQRGASVVLSSGKTDVYGWKSGFDADSGANVLLADSIDSLNFTKQSDDVIVASSGSSSIYFNDLSETDGAYRFLVNGAPVSFIAPDSTAEVSTNADLGLYYKAQRAGGVHVSSDVTTAFEVTLGSANLSNINKLSVDSESRATIWGSDAHETIQVSGSADAGARKYVAVGGGNDSIVSGGNDTTKAGNNFYFGEYNGVEYSSGKATISSFNFYKGNNDPNTASADLIYLGDFSNYRGVSATSNRLEISLAGDQTVIISDDFTTNDHKAVRAQFGGQDKVYNIKFGVSNGVNTFTYDGTTDIYYGGVSNSRARDVLNVDADQSNVNIWLNDSRLDTVAYGGIGMISASSVQNTKLTLAGGADNNTIVAGGNGTSTSLWGGGGEANSLVGGAGEETFFYFKSYGYTDNEGVQRSSTDTITTVGTDDLIWLYDVSLDEIDSEKTAISSGRIDVVLSNGGGLVVTGLSTETNFRVKDGDGWRDVKSVNTGSNRHWE